MSYHRIIARALAAALSLIACGANATTYTWPGAAPCAGTLQACVDGTANGDRIEVVATAINEDVSLYDKDRTLVAADGHHPAFGPGHWLSISSSSISGNRSVSVAGFTFVDGYVRASYRGTGTANYDLGRLVLNRLASDSFNYILVQAEAGTLNASVHENRITGLPAGAISGLMTLRAAGGQLNADAYYNHVQATTTDALVSGAGIFTDYAGSGSGGRARLHGNEIDGSFGLGSIAVTGGLYSSTATSYDARVYNNVVIGTGFADSEGIRYLVNTGTIASQTLANTVTRVDVGISAGPISGAAADSRINGIVSSNLVRANVGMYLDATHAPSLTNDYNLVNAATNLATLGTHTITADAKLVSDSIPRLRADSPAVDAADTSTVALGIIINGLPVLDADGLRRVKGADIDIGAYEYGDASLLHTARASNTNAHITYIDDAATNAHASADLLVTPNYTGDGSNPNVPYDLPYGVWYPGPQWTVFSEDFTAMPANADFNVFVPAAGAGVFRHVATASNTSGWSTQLDDSSVNNLPDRIVLATQDYSAGAIYNPHPIGVFYFAFGGPGAWFVTDVDQSADEMPVGAGFNIYAQEPSPNVFAVTATAGNSDGDAIVLDHPLLDGIPCAQPIVTRVSGGTPVTGNYDVYYTGGHWTIFGYGGMPLGTRFNVLVNPGQVAACTDRIFANGFD